MNNLPTTYTVDSLHILSLNTHKCYNVLISLLNSMNPVDYNILCIQEPPPDINKFPSLSSPHWDHLLPMYRTGSPDTLLYINKLIPSSTYKQNKILSSFITSITLTINTRTLHIFSLYNPPNSDDSPIRDTSAFITTLGPLLPSHALLIYGDFNRHHPLWAGVLFPHHTTRSDAEAVID